MQIGNRGSLEQVNVSQDGCTSVLSFSTSGFQIDGIQNNIFSYVVNLFHERFTQSWVSCQVSNARGVIP